MLLKGVQAEEQQGAVGGEEGSASDEEDKQEVRSSDEEGGHAVAAQADFVPESPCPSKQSGVLLSPAPSKRSSKPASLGQASPQSNMLLISNDFYPQAKSTITWCFESALPHACSSFIVDRSSHLIVLSVCVVYSIP